MSKDRLVIDEQRDGKFRISWFLAEEQEIGGSLGDGDDHLASADVAPTDRDGWECWTAAKVVAAARAMHDTGGYYWQSKADAAAVLRQIRQALKQERPMPEWAHHALAEGWKPPKGWKA